LLLGPAGSGKTALLRELRNRSRNIPNAFVDLETRRPVSTIDLMVDLVHQLSIGHSGLGRLKFPRFWLGRLVTELDMEQRPPEEQRVRVQSLLARIKRSADFPPT